MKWSKHDSNERNRLELKLIRSKFGAEGYGIYQALKEVFDENVDTEHTQEWGYVHSLHTIETLADECKVTPEKLKEYLTFCDEKGIYLKKDGRLFDPHIQDRFDDFFKRFKRENNITPELVRSDSGSVGAIEENRIDKNRKEKNRIEPIPQKNSSGSEVETFDEKKNKALLKAKQLVEDEVFNNPEDRATKHKFELLSVVIGFIALFILPLLTPLQAKTRYVITIKATSPVSSDSQRKVTPERRSETGGSSGSFRKNTPTTPAYSSQVEKDNGATRANLEETVNRLFGEDAKTALAIFKGESGLRADAMGWNCRYNGISKACRFEDRHLAWSVDCGIAQLNFKGQVCPPESFDPYWNIEKAYSWKYLPKKNNNQDPFTAWVIYTSGKYLKYL